MVSLLRSAAAAASAIPVAFAISSSSSSSRHQNPKPHNLSSRCLFPPSHRLGLARSFTNHRSPIAAVRTMDAPTSDHKSLTSSQVDAALPELLTEFMVDMKCEGCVSTVKDKLQTVEGVKNVEVDLPNQVVRILGSCPVKTMIEALEQTGRTARLIGQGVAEDFVVSAAVAEFKGPQVFGVVRYAQVNMELARIEANFSGLSPGKHGWSINEYGDLTRGAASTGKIYNPLDNATAKEPLGDLGTLDADEKGDAFFTGTKRQMRVVDLIGRSVVIYETEDKSDSGLAAAVIARSAGVGQNYKKICACDGTTIWEAGNKDFVTSNL